MWWVLLIAFVSCFLVQILINWLWISQIKKVYEKSQTFQKELSQHSTESYQKEIERLVNERTDLLNRMMSQDLRTYTTMTALTRSSEILSDEYVSAHDTAELQRLQQFSGVQGYGMINLEDEELSGMLSDFGIDLQDTASAEVDKEQ